MPFETVQIGETIKATDSADRPILLRTGLGKLPAWAWELRCVIHARMIFGEGLIETERRLAYAVWTAPERPLVAI